MAVQMPSRLYRSRSQKMIAGVAGGLGEYFDVDPVLIRLLFVVTAFISGAGILAYFVLWIVIPVQGDETPRMDALRRDFDDLSSRVREHIDPWGGSSRPGNAGPAPTGATAGWAGAAGDAPPEAGAAGDAPPEAGTGVDAPPDPGPGPSDPDPAQPAADDPGLHIPYDAPAAGAAGPSSRATYASAEPEPVADPAWPYGVAAGAAPIERRRRRQHWAGAVLIVVGLLILGNNLGLLWWAQARFVVPLIIVGAGAWLLFGMSRRG